MVAIGCDTRKGYDAFRMSAFGQKQTCAVQKGMSALPPIATAKAPRAVTYIRSTARGLRRARRIIHSRTASRDSLTSSSSSFAESVPLLVEFGIGYVTVAHWR